MERRTLLRATGVLGTAAVLGLAGCGDSATAPEFTPTPTPTLPTETPTPSAAATPTPTPTATPSRKPNPISVQALIEKRYDGRNLRRRELLTDAGAYRRYRVTYGSEDLTVSGIMNVPDGKGPFPVVVLAHGYINPRTYFPGQGMPREQDRLAREGYVVLHTDYRGHATSDDDPDVDYELRLPYAVDVINAAVAIKDSDLDYLDGDRIGVFGRSMGGNVVQNAIVAAPTAFRAATAWATTSSLAAENWKQFYRDSDDRRRVNDRIARSYGLPDESPKFWRAASPQDYFGRVAIPVQFHHGAEDETCPPRWAVEAERALRAAGKDVRRFSYAGAGHTFEGGSFTRAMDRTVDFFDTHLR